MLEKVEEMIMPKKIFLTQTILILTILFFSCNGKTQRPKNVTNIYKVELKNETWITDKILGLDPNIEKYNLTKFVERKFAGNLTNFPNETSFNSRYVAPCGNDYFTTVMGKYEFFDKDKLSITVDSVTYLGESEKRTKHRKPKSIIFVISKVADTIIFTKQNN